MDVAQRGADIRVFIPEQGVPILVLTSYVEYLQVKLRMIKRRGGRLFS
jgi:hypothetical protein